MREPIKTPSNWHWAITYEEIAQIKAGNRKAVDKVFFDNYSKFRAIAINYCRKKFKTDFIDDCVNQIYIDLPRYDFTDCREFYFSLLDSFIAASSLEFGRVCSYDTPIKSEKGDNLTLADMLGEEPKIFEKEEQEESARAVLEMLSEQEALTEAQKDRLTAFSLGVAFYRGLYEQESVRMGVRKY